MVKAEQHEQSKRASVCVWSVVVVVAMKWRRKYEHQWVLSQFLLLFIFSLIMAILKVLLIWTIWWRGMVCNIYTYIDMWTNVSFFSLIRRLRACIFPPTFFYVHYELKCEDKTLWYSSEKSVFLIGNEIFLYTRKRKTKSKNPLAAAADGIFLFLIYTIHTYV